MISKNECKEKKNPKFLSVIRPTAPSNAIRYLYSLKGLGQIRAEKWNSVRVIPLITKFRRGNSVHQDFGVQRVIPFTKTMEFYHLISYGFIARIVCAFPLRFVPIQRVYKTVLDCSTKLMTD